MCNEAVETSSHCLDFTVQANASNDLPACERLPATVCSRPAAGLLRKRADN